MSIGCDWRLETTSACRVWTVFSANQSKESRCHCSATNSCQNLPRRVGEIINSVSSAGPHFTGGGPPHGVPWSRMKCKWCGFWMCGGAAPAPTELLYIVRRQDWIYHHCGSCLSLFLFVSPCLFFCISYFLLFFPSFTPSQKLSWIIMLFFLYLLSASSCRLFLQCFLNFCCLILFL